MKKVPSVVVWLVIAGGLCIMALEIGAGRRQHNAHLAAAAYAERVRPLVLGDRRFQQVTVDEWSGYGAAVVAGSVASDADLEALHKLIEQTQPPGNIEMRWRVSVRAASDVGEASPKPADVSRSGINER